MAVPWWPFLSADFTNRYARESHQDGPSLVDVQAQAEDARACLRGYWGPSADVSSRFAIAENPMLPDGISIVCPGLGSGSPVKVQAS